MWKKSGGSDWQRSMTCMMTYYMAQDKNRKKSRIDREAHGVGV